MATLSIISLVNFFSGQQKSLDRGENHYKSGHIECFNYSAGVIRGEVRASMKKRTYKVTVYLDEDLKIKSTECECPQGEFKCSHSAAIFIYGIHNLSRTDVECQWKKKKVTETVQAASEMFPPPEKKKKYCPLSREPEREDRAWLYDQLKGYGRFTGVCWILSPEPEPAASLPIQLIDDILFSEEFLSRPTTESQLDLFKENCSIKLDVIRSVSSLTKEQRGCPAWHKARKGRLTASNFGAVLNAKRITPSLMKRLLGSYDLSGVRSISWGVDNEEMALGAFTRVTGLKVDQTGLWLHESGVLGASPDGLVGEDAVVECKCTYQFRNSTVAEACQSKDFCLEQQDGQYRLKPNHSYWHQCQGQIYMAKRMYCYFVMWTTKDVVVIKIERDATWAKNIDILLDFYFDKLFPKIVEGEL